MGTQYYSSHDTAAMTPRWATVWCTLSTIVAWPELTSATPLSRRQNQIFGETKAPSEGGAPQALISGAAAGVAVLILLGFSLVLCCPGARKAFHRRPTKPWIQTTTTTTVTHTDRAESNNRHSWTRKIRPMPTPLPMTRIADTRGPYLTADTEADLIAGGGTGPSWTRQPPLSMQRYSVHVSSQTSRRNSGGPLSSSSEAELASSHSAWSSRLTTPDTDSISWPPGSSSSDSRGNSPLPAALCRPDLAGRRGRPALQSIQVSAPRSPASVKGKGKGKARMYYY